MGETQLQVVLKCSNRSKTCAVCRGNVVAAAPLPEEGLTGEGSLDEVVVIGEIQPEEAPSNEEAVQDFNVEEEEEEASEDALEEVIVD